MDIFGSIADVFSHRSKQRNDVMVGGLFDFVDPVQIEVRLGLDVMERIIRYNAQFVHGFAGRDFNFDNVAVFVFFRPDGTHFFTGITWNHNTSSLGLTKKWHNEGTHRSRCLFIVSFCRTLRNDKNILFAIKGSRNPAALLQQLTIDKRLLYGSPIHSGRRLRSSNRVMSFRKYSGTVPTGPFRCLATISSATFFCSVSWL